MNEIIRNVFARGSGKTRNDGNGNGKIMKMEVKKMNGVRFTVAESGHRVHILIHIPDSRSHSDSHSDSRS